MPDQSATPALQVVDVDGDQLVVDVDEDSWLFTSTTCDDTVAQVRVTQREALHLACQMLRAHLSPAAWQELARVLALDTW